MHLFSAMHYNAELDQPYSYRCERLRIKWRAGLVSRNLVLNFNFNFEKRRRKQNTFGLHVHGAPAFHDAEFESLLQRPLDCLCTPTCVSCMCGALSARGLLRTYTRSKAKSVCSGTPPVPAPGGVMNLSTYTPDNKIYVINTIDPKSGANCRL